MTLEKLIKSVDPSTLDSQDPWRNHYWNWAQHHLAHSFDLPACDDEATLQALSRRIQGESDMGRLYAVVASNLIAMFNGEASPLELLLDSGLP